MSFLPPNYSSPTSDGKYFKPKEGDNRVRIVSEAVIGFELWIDHKPVRRHDWREFSKEDLAAADQDESGKARKPKHFWACAAIDYADKSIKVWEITQSSIMDAIEALVHDSDWGDPKDYDLSVSRSGKGLETTYSVVPKPKKELGEGAGKLWQKTLEDGFNLEALFEGGDPFTFGQDEVLSPPDEINVEDIPFN